MSLYDPQVLFTDDPEVVSHRELSCFCNGEPCFKTAQARLRTSKEKTNEQTTTKEKTNEQRTTKEKTNEQRTTEERTNEQRTNEEMATQEGTVRAQNRVLKPVIPSNAKIGEYCVIVYEGEPYPGVIDDVDADSVEVNSMARVGKNRFFWPLREDKIWYKYDDVITWIPPPEKVTNRHHQVAMEYWSEILEKLDVD